MMTRKSFSPAAAIAAFALLSACGESEEAPAVATTDNVGPQGEVRGGTISDAMLPLDSVRSQSPRRGGDAGNDGENSGDAAEGEGDAG